MKRIVYLFTGIAFILVSTIRCEKESIGTDDLQTSQQEEVLSKNDKKIRKADVLVFDEETGTWETLKLRGDEIQAQLDLGGGALTVTNPITGRTWMDRNLGASQVATSSDDAAAYGYSYQWGRGTDGHQLRGSDTTEEQSSGDQPGHAKYITGWLWDWRNPDNNGLWQGVNGINNPCPPGFRIPTELEWFDEIETWSPRNATGAFASLLKLPANGHRDKYGDWYQVGTDGYYWSSSTGDTVGPWTEVPRNPLFSWRMNFVDNEAGISHWALPRKFGLACRCIED